MGNNHYISKISEIYDIPASTLRFWEKEGLISPGRNSENDYREYNLERSFVEIGDTNFYRGIGMSISEIKRIKSYDIESLKAAFVTSCNEIEKKIATYAKRLAVTKEKIALIGEIQNAPEELVPAEIPFDKAIICDRGNKEHICRYLDDPNCFVTVGKIGNGLQNDLNCIAVEADFPGEAAFVNSRKKTCLLSYFRSATHDTRNNNFDKLLNKLSEQGIACERYVTQFIISVCEDGVQYDYYKVWFLPSDTTEKTAPSD